jgi:hypothetical protein
MPCKHPICLERRGPVYKGCCFWLVSLRISKAIYIYIRAALGRVMGSVNMFIVAGRKRLRVYYNPVRLALFSITQSANESVITQMLLIDGFHFLSQPMAQWLFFLIKRIRRRIY